MRQHPTIILSRTDNLGDVVLTLPLAGILKAHFGQCRIFFIGKSYTRPIIESCVYVDRFLDKEQLLSDAGQMKQLEADAIIFVYPDPDIAKIAKAAGIPLRIGTSHRWYHWLYCNRKVGLSRKKSPLHEAQLNAQLLQPLGITVEWPTEAFPPYYGMAQVQPLPKTHQALLATDKFKLIIHPKSKGSAREWPMQAYYKLATLLPAQTFQLFITGTAAEGDLIRSQMPAIFELSHVTDLTGRLSLAELMGFIKAVDGLLACSTGPLHIAAAMGKFAWGIYPPMRPLHPGRWRPLGAKAQVMVLDKDCSACRQTQDCACIRAITPQQVAEQIMEGYASMK